MMNQEDIFRKVGQILNELQDQYEFLAQNPKQLNELELELFLANANFLSDHVQIVRKINSNKPQKTLPEHTETQVLDDHFAEAEMTLPAITPEVVQEFEQVQEEKEQSLPVVQIPVEEETFKPAFQDELFKLEDEREAPKFEFMMNETSLTDKFEFEEQSIDDIFDRPLSKEEAEIIAQKKQLLAHQFQQPEKEDKEEPYVEAEIPAYTTKEESPVVIKEVVPDPVFEPILDKVEEKLVFPASTEPVPDKIEEKIVVQPLKAEAESNPVRPTLNDLLAGRNSQSGGFNQDNNKPAISDLKQAINLNEKLLYIKDLFNGYNLAYAEAIELINKMPDFKTADTFLKNNYAVKNNWASKQSTVDQFYELLNQRFPAK